MNQRRCQSLLKPNEKSERTRAYRQDSAQTDLVLLGLALPNEGEEKLLPIAIKALLRA